MKIDFDKAIKGFIKYTEKYDLKNENIYRKQQHSLRVMKISEQIARSMKLDEEKVALAALIGLLHDIARFEQYTQYKTFHDYESFDHGDYGVEILKKDIRKYIDSSEYDDIIFCAIKNHNKYSIEEGLDGDKLLFAKLIRDADKIDILYEGIDWFWKDMDKEISEASVSDYIYEPFTNRKLIKRELGKTYKYKDGIIAVIALVFDINFKESFGIVLEKNYINRILDRFEYKVDNDKMEQVRKIANDYIKERVD